MKNLVIKFLTEKKLVLIFLSCLLLMAAQKSQDRPIPIYVTEIYPSLRLISRGPWISHPSFIARPYLPNPEGEYSFFFRMLVANYELWDVLYLEKISGFDEEGTVRRVTESKYLNLDELFPQADFREQRYIKSITWIDSVTTELRINGQLYQIDISKHIPYKLFSIE